MFEISAPQPQDALRIASIHVEAMNTNPLLHVQFPTPEALKGLVEYLARDTLQCLQDPRKGVLASRDRETGEIASFAKWVVARSAEEDLTVEAVVDEPWPETSVSEYLDRYSELADAAMERSFGKQPCYRECLSLISPGSAGT